MKRTLALLALGALCLTSCGNSENAAEREKATVYSVEELISDKTLFNAVFEKCQGNPGELRNTPNCVNAYSALHKKQAKGTYLPPSP